MSRVVKIVQAYRFELVDFFNIYSHVPVSGKHGKGYIERVNAMKDIVVIRDMNDGTVYEQSVNSAKLMLRKLAGIRGKDIKILCNLALNKNGQNFTATTDGNLIVCSNSKYRLLLDFNDNNLSISAYELADASYITLQVANIPFIVAYLISNGFDLYNLLGRGFAISTNTASKPQ